MRVVKGDLGKVFFEPLERIKDFAVRVLTANIETDYVPKVTEKLPMWIPWNVEYVICFLCFSTCKEL